MFSIGARGGARDIANLSSPSGNSSFWEHPPFDTFWMRQAEGKASLLLVLLQRRAKSPAGTWSEAVHMEMARK